MKQKHWLRFGLSLPVVCALLLSFTGCGEQLAVTILDREVKTQLSVASGQTVEDILAEAEIVLQEDDLVSPPLDSEIAEGNNCITIDRHVQVSVTASGKTSTVELTGGTVQDALREAGIKLGKNDVVNHALDAYLLDGMEILVTHRLNVFLSVDGKTTEFLTEAKTVKELLQSENISLGKNDRISPKQSTKLRDGTKIVIKRVEYKKKNATETIAYTTQTQYDSSMESGTSRVVTSGVNGEQEVVYRITYVDGKEESRTVLQKKVTKEPVAEVVVYGTKAAPTTTPSESPSSKPSGGKTVVSKQKVDDCDGSGHGYYIITYSDGSVEYEDY